MVGRAAGDESRVGVFGIDVVQVDQAQALADRRSEEMLYVAALSREVPERAPIVRASVHEGLVPDAPDAMRLIVARTAQPAEVGVDVIPALGAEHHVVNVDPGAALAVIARLTEALQAEARSCVRVSYAW